MLDKQAKVYHGECFGYPFSALPNGTLVCQPVPDIVRDEMRIQAGSAFLFDRRAIGLSFSEASYWRAVTTITVRE